MENNSSLFFILLVFFLIVFTLKQLNRFRDLKGIFLSKAKYAIFDEFYSKYFNFYNQLNKREKRKFIFRAYNLINHIKVVGREGFKVTEKVKLFIVAAEVQLTFGFRNYFLSRFKTVFIYPDAYRNPITGNMHDGEVNPRGLIVLSWKKLLKGHAVPDDKINLALHEFAHALMITILKSNKHEVGLDAYLNKILKLSKEEIVKIKNSDHHFFREYAGTNIFEFFSIAVEYFFEVPVEFKKELPQLYYHMVSLLKQDPALKQFQI